MLPSLNLSLGLYHECIYQRPSAISSNWARFLHWTCIWQEVKWCWCGLLIEWWLKTECTPEGYPVCPKYSSGAACFSKTPMSLRFIYWSHIQKQIFYFYGLLRSIKVITFKPSFLFPRLCFLMDMDMGTLSEWHIKHMNATLNVCL